MLTQCIDGQIATPARQVVLRVEEGCPAARLSRMQYPCGTFIHIS